MLAGKRGIGAEVPQPLLPLLGRLLLPLTAQRVALRRWQLLEALEGVVQLLLLVRWQRFVQMLVLLCLLTLFRRHLLPAFDVVADLLLTFRRHRFPIPFAIEQAFLPARGKGIPLRLERAEQTTLGGRQ